MDQQLIQLIEEHRQSLVKFNVDLGYFVRKRVHACELAIAKVHKTGSGRDLTQLQERLKAFREMQEEMHRLRSVTDCISRGHRITAYEQFGKGNGTKDPSPEQIRAECEKFQENWTDWERERRGGLREEVTIRSVRMIDRNYKEDV
jgi:hypothetical protein